MSSKDWLIEAAINTKNAKPLPTAFELDGDIQKRWSTIVQATGVPAARIADTAAENLGIERADFSKLEPDYARQVSENLARTHLVLPIVIEGQRALVASADPTDSTVLQELAFSLGAAFTVYLATPDEIEARLAEVYGDDGGDFRDWGSVSSSLLTADLVLRRKDGTAIEFEKSATAKLFSEILRRAVHLNASDVHIQPYGTGAVIRNRIDGVLYKTVELPAKVHGHLIRHVEAISGMDPTKRMLPQDGELHMEVERSEVDLRLSVIPLSEGERLVVRLLPQNQARELSSLQLKPEENIKLRELCQSTSGMILMTGPTGSGKTSLLYAMLAEKNTPDINIMTVEEPVEYRLRGASQINVETRAGLTFARSLRSILRQDPDVVMIGEIRDEETAHIAVQAAMTGHFVLSTVHTLDALLATVRMRDLGVSAATLADSLNAVASQRLVRALCSACRQPLESHELTDDEQLFAGLWCTPAWKAVGCETCRGTGFSGRVPVLEIVDVQDQLRNQLRTGAENLEQLEASAAATGTRFLPEGFAQRIEEGFTTVEEAVRVYGRVLFNRLGHIKNLRQTIDSE